MLKTKSEAWESLSRIRDEREETRKLLEKLKTVPLASGETEISRGIRISLTEDKVSQQTERLDDVSNEILKKEDELSEIGGAKGWPPSGT